MPSSPDRIALLREAIQLEQQRAALQARVEQIARQLSSGGGRMAPAAFSKTAKRAVSAPAPTPAAPKKAGAAALRKTNGHQRGQLTAAIHETLKAAGNDGATVADMARKFGVPTRNLFVWFSTTGRNFKTIVKAAPGRYRLNG